MCGHLSVVSFPLFVYVPSDTLKNAYSLQMFRFFDFVTLRNDSDHGAEARPGLQYSVRKRLPGDSVIRENQPYKVFQLGSRRTSYDSRNHDARN
jgi:hypothetical protein